MTASRAHRRVRIVAALSLLLLPACSGGDSNGSPTGPTDPVASVTVTLPSTTIAVGGTVTPQATARDAQGRGLQATFTWRVDDEDVALIASDGKVSGRTAGTVTVTATAAGIAGSAELDIEPRNLDAMVEAVRAARGLPAMAGAIVSSRGLIGVGVAGTRRASGGAVVTMNDRWHIGSNLKAITSALAAIAVGRGTIEWTTTIEEAFPDLDDVMLDAYRGVTLEQLLAHGGGIPRDAPTQEYAGATARTQRESAIAWVLTTDPIGPVGSYAYSNLGYVIAGAMIERALDGTYEDLLQSELGNPLGVTGLGWGPADGGGADQPVGHYLQGGWTACAACDNPPGLSAAGRAHMRITDWAAIIEELLRADAGTSSLIEAANGRKLFTAHTPLPGSTEGYGLGWIITSRDWAGGRTASHDGSNTVNHSVAWLGLQPGIAFLAITNAADLNGGTTSTALDALIGSMLGLWQGGI